MASAPDFRISNTGKVANNFAGRSEKINGIIRSVQCPVLFIRVKHLVASQALETDGS